MDALPEEHPAQEHPARLSGQPPAVDVLLVSMPFGILHSPSLALGILQARLKSAGISARSRHFTIDYAARAGVELYNRISGGFPRTTDLLGEWIFSHAVSPQTATQRERYVARTFGAHDSGSASNEQKIQLIEDLVGLAGWAGTFADYAAREILRSSPRVVGLTSVFQQNMAAVAVAARLRKLDPCVKIVMGGANCEGPMGEELARTYPFLDVVVSGEADLVIAPLVQSLLAGEDPRDNASLRRHVQPGAGAGLFLQAEMVADLSGHAAPEFADYFADLGLFPGEADKLKVQIPMETSRGCWWGMKHHCTFCGLNGSTMAFRSRPADAVVSEILGSAERYPGAKISFVDNIMDYRYFDTLLPQLADSGVELDLFYEIKSNVSKAQVKALKDAGVGHIQPGIESLSDPVLKIMKKGVRAIQNVQLLKWCTELGVEADWNLLWGFPGEDPDEYRRMAELVPLICHLQPPARGSQIRLDRFSPNFTASTALGFSNVRPYPAYYDVYLGLPREAVFNLAYFFEADSEAGDKIGAYTRGLSDAIARWRDGYRLSGLTYLELGGRVVLFDTRAMVADKRTHVLDDLQSKVFLYCDTARSPAAIGREFPEASTDEIAAVLAAFCEQGILWCDGDHYLSLAVCLTTFLQSRGTDNVEEAIDGILANRAAG